MYKRVVQVWRQVQDCLSFYQDLRYCPVVGLWSRTYPPFFLAPCPVTINLLHILLHPCHCLLTDSTQELLRLQKPSIPTVVSIPNQRAEKHAHDQVESTTGGPWAATSPWIQECCTGLFEWYGEIIFWPYHTQVYGDNILIVLISTCW